MITAESTKACTCLYSAVHTHSRGNSINIQTGSDGKQCFVLLFCTSHRTAVTDSRRIGLVVLKQFFSTPELSKLAKEQMAQHLNSHKVLTSFLQIYKTFSLSCLQ